jgi:hypothetical protein
MWDQNLCSAVTLNEAIGKMDVLFKFQPECNGCAVALYGHDAKKAAARLNRLSHG